jgi:uncharacterized protein YjbJ (UPF0337 family)
MALEPAWVPAPRWPGTEGSILHLRAVLGRASVFGALGWVVGSPTDLRREPNMGIIDKVTGKAKQAAGDVTGDPSLRRKGRKEERKGEAKEEMARHEERADDKAAEVADLERDT